MNREQLIYQCTNKDTCGFFLKILIVLAVILIAALTCGKIVRAEAPSVKISILFNNVPYKENLKTSWGFSCLIEGMDQTILFDTGGDGNILLSNMRQMGIDPGVVEVVVLSHIHADHVGGLESFLEKNSNVVVYLPESFPATFKQAVRNRGVKVEEVSRQRKLLEGVYTTGEMGDWIKEQSLVLTTSKGLVIITGCAHPGVVNIVRKVRGHFKADVYMVMGGFHLLSMSDSEIQKIIHMLKELGVQKVAPSHCTGDLARTMFRKTWGNDFIESGIGAVIELSRQVGKSTLLDKN